MSILLVNFPRFFILLYHALDLSLVIRLCTDKRWFIVSSNRWLPRHRVTCLLICRYLWFPKFLRLEFSIRIVWSYLWLKDKVLLSDSFMDLIIPYLDTVHCIHECVMISINSVTQKPSYLKGLICNVAPLVVVCSSRYTTD